MSEISILDASAVLAYLNAEKGDDVVEEALDREAWITAVNYSEVLGKLCEKGMPLDEARRAVDALGMVLRSFDEELAILAASLRPRTAEIGASLGDRACLALGESATTSGRNVRVLTAERAWKKLKWGFEVALIRGS